MATIYERADGSTVKLHECSALFPWQSESELQKLSESIVKIGLRFPLVFNAKGELVDGKNRLKACDLAGVEPTIDALPKGVNEVEYCLAVNIRRRHLTAKEKRELIAKLLAMQPEKSDRQIAKMAKDDHKKVARIRAGLEGRGALPHVETREDTMGRRQPSRVLRFPSRPVPEPEPAPYSVPVKVHSVPIKVRSVAYVKPEPGPKLTRPPMPKAQEFAQEEPADMIDWIIEAGELRKDDFAERIAKGLNKRLGKARPRRGARRR
jgi:hypothetical protein